MKTEFKHTTGDWQILWGNYGTYCSINSDKNERIATIYSNIPVNGQDKHSGMANEENGNAILIHAAPDLLEALNDLIEKTSPHIYKLGVQNGFSELLALEKAKKAIRKATLVKE